MVAVYVCSNNAARGRETALMMSKGQAYARARFLFLPQISALVQRVKRKKPGGRKKKTATKRKENGSSEKKFISAATRHHAPSSETKLSNHRPRALKAVLGFPLLSMLTLACNATRFDSIVTRPDSTRFGRLVGPENYRSSFSNSTLSFLQPARRNLVIRENARNRA